MPHDAVGGLSLEQDETGTITVGGTLTAETVPEALERSRGWFRSGNELAINLSDVTHSDSAGVALLLEWLRRARANQCAVCYLNAPPQMVAIAEFGELGNILHLESKQGECHAG